jgi:hypothetical protein
MAMLTESGMPITTKVFVTQLSKSGGRPVDDRQIRRALYSLSDRGLVELRIHANPWGRPAICAYLPGAMATFDAQMHRPPPGLRPVRPPKSAPRTVEGECRRLVDAALNFAYAEPDDSHDAFVELITVAMDFKPPLTHSDFSDS